MSAAKQKLLDAIADATSEEFRLFREKHRDYFYWEGRIDPVTGRPVIERQPALHRESFRLFEIKNAASKVALDYEFWSKCK